jgi:hypothetical protein
MAMAVTAKVAMLASALLWGAPEPATCGPDDARAVAIVTEIDGSARIFSPGRAAPPEIADSVPEDAIVVLERGARIVLVYPIFGSIYEAQGPGRFIARREAVELRGGAGQVSKRDIAAVLRALKIRTVGTTLQGSAAMRGVSALELQAEGPTGSRLLRDPIGLCWRSLGTQWLYRVRLIDDDGAVLFETQTADSALEVPAAVPVEPGASYIWHVVATGPSGQSIEAAGQFRELDAQSERALLQAESAIPELDATGRTLIRIARRQQGVSERSVDCPSGPPERRLSASAGSE